jgi:hypothetical protein
MKLNTQFSRSITWSVEVSGTTAGLYGKEPGFKPRHKQEFLFYITLFNAN